MAVVYKVKEGDREFLRRVHGKLVTHLGGLKGKVYSVGDRVSFELITNGIKPWAVFYDLHEMRKSVDEKTEHLLNNFDGTPLVVENPPGVITHELWDIAHRAVNESMKVFVVGEEDLAATALFAVAEEGSTIVYGLKDKGAVVATVTKEIKNSVRRLLGI